MIEVDRDRQVYDVAMEFIRGLDGIDQKDIADHLTLPDAQKCVTMPGIYEQLLWSAQSPNMMPSVISKSIDGGIPSLKETMCGFCPRDVEAEYHEDWERLLDDIIANVAPTGKVRKEKQSIWPRFCGTALSGARFLAQFEDGNDFNNWVKGFDDERSRAALPMLLAEEIRGFGFAVAADFLKEIGFCGYAKPDVHLREIFRALNVCGQDDDAYHIYKAIIRMAKKVSQTPFHVDKLFWLIGSGNFHVTGKKIPRQKKAFIKYARERGL